jgi:hypothetical protein
MTSAHHIDTQFEINAEYRYKVVVRISRKTTTWIQSSRHKTRDPFPLETPTFL